MFKAKAAAPLEVDAWPVTVAGFPPRVVHALETAGIGSVGDLRRLSDAERAMIRNIGAGSVEDMRHFFEKCDALADQRIEFQDLGALFEAFLTPPQRAILEWRHGLCDAGAAGETPTLQRIANRLDVSRERVRQVEGLAIRTLGSRLAQQCLAAVYDAFHAFVDSNGGMVPAALLAGFRQPALLGDYPPGPVLSLLCRCGGDIVRHRGLYSTLALEALEDAEQRLLDRLRERRTPATLPDLVPALAGLPAVDGGISLTGRARLLLENTPGVSATRDERYFTGAAAACELLSEVAKPHRRAVHFRILLREVNTLLKPGSRLGAGRLLALLHDNPRFEKGASGHYGLKADACESPTVALAPNAPYR